MKISESIKKNAAPLNNKIETLLKNDVSNVAKKIIQEFNRGMLDPFTIQKRYNVSSSTARKIFDTLAKG